MLTKGAAKIRAGIIVAVAAVALLALGVWQWEWDASWLESWIGQHALLGAAIYVVRVAASVVLLPLSSLPLLPLATRSYGVVLTALLSAAGWWAGCMIAFQIARFGRRYLERFTSMEAIDRLEDKVPEDAGFGGIVVLRMILPVDVVSFALGLMKRLRFRTYAVASLSGILPFAFVRSYAGGQLGAGPGTGLAGICPIWQTQRNVAMKTELLGRRGFPRMRRSNAERRRIRRTGMPSFRSSLDDRQIWTLALFLKHMDNPPPAVQQAWEQVRNWPARSVDQAGRK